MIIERVELHVSREQHAAIGQLLERLPHARSDKIWLEQTYTPSGGTHLYVEVPRQGVFHVARNGNVQELRA